MSIILHGPQGTGKSIHAPRIAAYFRLNKIEHEPDDVRPGTVYLLPLVDRERFESGTKLYVTHAEPPLGLQGSRRVVSIALALSCVLSYEMRDLAAFSRAVRLAVDGMHGCAPRLSQVSTIAALERLGIAPRLQTAPMTTMTRQALLALGWTPLLHHRTGSQQRLYVRPERNEPAGITQ